MYRIVQEVDDDCRITLTITMAFMHDHITAIDTIYVDRCITNTHTHTL